MTRVLVTGASGLVGANLVLAFSGSLRVSAVYHSHPVRTPAVDSHRCDVTDAAAVASLVRHVRPDWIVHAAALANVDECERRPEEARSRNVAATRHVAAAAAASGARMVYLSTDAVFDGLMGWYHEEDAPGPLNEYARTKLGGEEAARTLAPDALIIRTNIYGWNMQPKESLAEWVRGRLIAGTPVDGFTDVYFCPLLVNDLAEMIRRMIQDTLSGVYHVAGSERCSKHGFARRLAEVFGLDPDLVRRASVADSPLVARRPRDTSLSTDKLRRDLGIALPGLDEGLHRFKTLGDAGYPARLRALGAEAQEARGNADR